MLAKELIDRLEQQGMLDQEIIEALREQLDQSGRRVTPEALAKLLVDNGQLTRFQATKLVGEVRSGGGPAPTADEEAATAAAIDSADDLGLIEEDSSVVEAEPVDAEPVEAIPVEAVPVTAVPVAAVPVHGAAVAEAVPVGGSPGGFDGAPYGSADVAGDQSEGPNRRKMREPKGNVWDNFRIYGVAAAVVFLALTAFAFWWLLGREDEGTYSTRADDLFKNANWEQARTLYGDYESRYGSSAPNSGTARVRYAIASVHVVKQTGVTPVEAKKSVKETIEPVLQEEAYTDNEGEVAELMVTIAEDIAASADRKKETADKEGLLTELDELRLWIGDGGYMSVGIRKGMEQRLDSLDETRDRIFRDISKDKRLVATVESMQANLDGRKTKSAYDDYTNLIREYPELRQQDQLMSLIGNATEIQRELVKPSLKQPKVSTESEAAEKQSVVLASVVGPEVPGLANDDDRSVFYRIGGSVMAVRVRDGSVLWRKYVGSDQELNPVLVSKKRNEGVLLSDSKSYEIQRVSPAGDVVWKTAIGEKHTQPQVVGNRVYTCTYTGRVICLSIESGQPNWVTTIPQPLQSGISIFTDSNTLYVTGDHSNLYVLDAAKGKCLEVLYVGHEEGTVKVPPVALMNHLFVFENTGSDEALLHVYAMGMNGDRPTGTSLKLAQKDIRLRGNVITPAEIFERRLVVLTDLGEIKVLDVEPGKIDGDKVNLAAEKSTSYSEPTLAKMVLGKSRMWVTGSSIQAYTLEITRGRIPPKWSHSKGDIFIGDAVLFEDTVIAARILKGTETVRVEAYDAKEGTRYWRTDLGAPISMLVSTDGGVHAATTQGALFKLTGEDLRNGSTRAPVENPGKNLINVRFSGPVSMDKGRMVMMNSLGSDIMAIYDPNRRTEKLRTITFPTEGIPSTPAVFAGGGVCVPVRAGRVTLINPNTGGRLGSPFQPPTRPNKPLKWTWPTNVPEDPDSIVVGTETQTLYRLRISDQIRELNSEKIDAKLFGRLAATNSAVFGASAAATGDQLQWYDIASLKQQGKKLLKGRIVFGPSTSGELVLVQTDDNVLRAFNDAGTQSWECKLPAGGLADTPVIVDNQMIATGKRGWVVRISTDNGKVLGQTDLGQPLFGNPLVLNGRMLIPGSEGVVFVDALP